MVRLSCMWGTIIMYVGGFPLFAHISPDAGNRWYSFDPLFDGDLTFSSNRVPCNPNLRDPNGNIIRNGNNCKPNLTGDSDVIYTPFGGGMFIWYRQGVDDRLSLGISPDAGLKCWRFVPPFGIEDLVAGASETVRNQWNFPARCEGPANPSNPNQRYVNAYWWDFPQLALSNRYLYLSTDNLLGCTTDPRVWTDPKMPDTLTMRGGNYYEVWTKVPPALDDSTFDAPAVAIKKEDFLSYP
jgi:hypothetical protein